MIIGVTGFLGGGKSYDSVARAVEHLRKDRVLCSNIELNLPSIARDWGLEEDRLRQLYRPIDVDSDGDPWAWPRGDPRGSGTRRVLVIIDEAGEWFGFDGARDKSFRSWLRQSDKRGQDVLLIVQHSSILSKQGRVLVHRWRTVLNFRAWKIPGLGVGLPWPWCNRFRVCEYDSLGSTLLGREFYYHDARVYRAYETSAMFGASAVASLASGVSAYDGLDGGSVKRPARDYSFWFWGLIACLFLWRRWIGASLG